MSSAVLAAMGVPLARVARNRTVGKGKRVAQGSTSDAAGALLSPGIEVAARRLAIMKAGGAAEPHRSGGRTHYGTPRSSCDSSTSDETPCPATLFEEAITRLAAAVGVGTEPLIYVRRSDVTELVDALMRQARRAPPGSPIVTSPALERLAIVRRSSGSAQGSCRPAVSSAHDGSRPDTARSLQDAFVDGEARSRGGNPSPGSARVTREDKLASGVSFKSGGTPAAASPRSSPNCGMVRSRIGDQSGSRRSGGPRDGEHSRRWRVRSPPRIPSTRPASLDRKVAELPVSPRFSPMTGIETSQPRYASRFSHLGPPSAFPAAPSPKVASAPITPRETSGANAFQDFWSSGL